MNTQNSKQVLMVPEDLEDFKRIASEKLGIGLPVSRIFTIQGGEIDDISLILSLIHISEPTRPY